jgi:hypothetical protein
MQLNVHVPKDREAVLAELEAEASATGRPKNQIVLDALAEYLHSHRHGRKPRLRTWNLGTQGELHRVDLYDEPAEVKQGQDAE